MSFYNKKMTMDGVRCFHEHAKKLKENRVIVTALAGSQNYYLDTPDSDIDVKTLVYPKLETVALNKKPESETVIIPETNEHIEIRDYRLQLETFKKMNINFLETLFTPYYVVEKDFEETWNKLRKNAEAIASYDPCRMIKSIIGQMYDKIKHLGNGGISRQEIVDKYGYDPKQLIHILRFADFLKRRFKCEESFKDCLCALNGRYYSNELNQVFGRPMVEMIRAGEVSASAAWSAAAEAIKYSEKMIKNPFLNQPKKEIENFLEEISIEFYKIAIQKYSIE